MANRKGNRHNRDSIACFWYVEGGHHDGRVGGAA